MRSRFHKKVAIITGASSGIGKATALAFAREGMRIVLASRNRDLLDAVEREVRAVTQDVFSFPTDVTDPDMVKALVSETLHRFGSIDILVCSAGLYVRSDLEHYRVDDFARALEVNFFGSLHVILAVLPIMLKQGSGHIVAVSSVDGKKGLLRDAPYAASKFALTGFMDVLCQELHGTGVHATTVLPGRVDTPMIEHLKVPIVSRKISPDRVARTILRGVRHRSPEVTVPILSSRSLLMFHLLSPALANWMVRLFRLEGVEIAVSPTDNA